MAQAAAAKKTSIHPTSAPFILRVLNQFQEALTARALVSVDETSARAQVLPLM